MGEQSFTMQRLEAGERERGTCPETQQPSLNTALTGKLRQECSCVVGRWGRGGNLDLMWSKQVILGEVHRKLGLSCLSQCQAPSLVSLVKISAGTVAPQRMPVWRQLFLSKKKKKKPTIAN